MELFPLEIKFEILNYISKEELVYTVSLLNKEFHEIVTNIPDLFLIKIVSKIKFDKAIQNDGDYSGYFDIYYFNFSLKKKWKVSFTDPIFLEFISKGATRQLYERFPKGYSINNSKHNIPFNGLFFTGLSYHLIKDEYICKDLTREEYEDIETRIIKKHYNEL